MASGGSGRQFFNVVKAAFSYRHRTCRGDKLIAGGRQREYRNLRNKSSGTFQLNEIGFTGVRSSRKYISSSTWRTSWDRSLAFFEVFCKQLFLGFGSLKNFVPQFLLQQKPLPLTYLILPFPLKVFLNSASCDKYVCECGYSNSADGKPCLKCNCQSCSPQPTCPNPEPKESCEKPCKDDSTQTCKNGRTPVKWCEPEKLTHKVLVRQACQLTVDSVTRILSETITAYQDYHCEYRRLLDIMIDALEMSRTAHGTDLELLDCKIIMIRSRVDEMRCNILELESFMCSIQKLCEATAETAFLGHAEYHSVAMSERLQSAAMEMKLIKEETVRKERDMIEIQSVVIVESGRSLK